ncbi:MULTISPECIES: shikimate dehydrogenase [Sutcliffiella]|uniref:shikimate dehydrogenase n=1 Tax=Sutcliffiella TaxID=2837511 RepID=UPI0022DDC5B2|nr:MULTISPECIES: shikimate dehydrogenase [Sutcliffiella]MED4016454.1 shikimate dehydrogenase [Sutcliffiella cohnii]WBL13894.1 shikimate dehydrogenase [Sutcliffiella sp. NC1]
MSNLYGVIGCPIAHSLSPLIHNDALAQHHIKGYYDAFHVEVENLEDAVKGFRALGVRGFNITIPHKVGMLSLVDEIDEGAQKIGAINTVVNDNGTFIGYNTDGVGFVNGLKNVTQLDDKKILVIGAGGASRAIVYSLLLEKTAKVDIVNRSTKKAVDLLEEYEAFKSDVFSFDTINNIEDYDIIVNTTSVGMHPHVNEMPISLDGLKKGAIVSDIIYNPLQTTLLSKASEIGAITQNGVPMFVNQGAVAFQLWTGIYPDTERMTKLVEQQLGGTTSC